MSDIPMSTMEPGTRPSLPPPVTETGVIGWMRHNLFATWFDALLTLLELSAGGARRDAYSAILGLRRQ